KRGVAVERRNLGAVFEAFGTPQPAAVAGLGAADAGAFDDDPASAAALAANRLRGHCLLLSVLQPGVASRVVGEKSGMFGRFAIPRLSPPVGEWECMNLD